MKTIGGFLERYKNFIPPSLAVSRAVCTVLKNHFNMEVAEKVVHVSRGMVNISLGGAQKTEILLHKKEILSAVRMLVGDSVRDIR